MEPNLSLSNNRTTATENSENAIDCKVMYPNWWFEADDGSILSFYCNSWQCLTCRKRNRRKMRVMVLKLATAFNLRYFWTLTIPQDMPLYDSWDYIQNCWHKFTTIYKRKTTGNLQYIRISEPHKSGYPHIHFLTNKHINVRWFREQWKRLGGGYRIHVECVSIRRIAGYLSKYLSKMETQLPKGFRHYSLSKQISMHWQIIRYKSDKTWKLLLWVWVDLPDFGHIQIIREVCKIDFLVNNEYISVPPAQPYEILNRKTAVNSN